MNFDNILTFDAETLIVKKLWLYRLYFWYSYEEHCTYYISKVLDLPINKNLLYINELKKVEQFKCL